MCMSLLLSQWLRFALVGCRGNTVIQDIHVFDYSFGAFNCSNATVPYAGNITCTWEHAVTSDDMESGPLQLTANVQSMSSSYSWSSAPVYLDVYSNPGLQADIVAANCSTPHTQTYGKREVAASPASHLLVCLFSLSFQWVLFIAACCWLRFAHPSTLGLAVPFCAGGASLLITCPVILKNTGNMRLQSIYAAATFSSCSVESLDQGASCNCSLVW